MYRSFGLYARVYSGRGALYKGRSHTERSGGLYTRENAGISSESMVRIHAVENLRFPGEGSSAQGKSGPNTRPKGVVDGKQVQIPALLKCIELMGTHLRSLSEQMEKFVPQGGVKIVAK